MKLSAEAAIGVVAIAALGYYLYGQITEEFSGLAQNFKDAISGAGDSVTSAASSVASTVSNVAEDAVSLPGDLIDSLLNIGPGSASNEGDVLSNLGLQPGQTQVGVSNGGTW